MKRYLSLIIAILAMKTNLSAAEAGMPQLDPTYWASQAFWLILIFAIFPTIYSIFFAVSRVRFTGDGLKFRYVGLRNFSKQFFGSSEVHFLGRTDPVSIFGYTIFVIIVVALLVWLWRSQKYTTWVGMIGRTIWSCRRTRRPMAVEAAEAIVRDASGEESGDLRGSFLPPCQ